MKNGHTNFHIYSTKIEVPISQNREWPTIMAQTLYIYIYTETLLRGHSWVSLNGKNPLIRIPRLVVISLRNVRCDNYISFSI